MDAGPASTPIRAGTSVLDSDLSSTGEGILESIIELGRQELAVTLRQNSDLQLKKPSSSATKPESALLMETGPRLVG